VTLWGGEAPIGLAVIPVGAHRRNLARVRMRASAADGAGLAIRLVRDRRDAVLTMAAAAVRAAPVRVRSPAWNPAVEVGGGLATQVEAGWRGVSPRTTVVVGDAVGREEAMAASVPVVGTRGWTRARG
jgi:hypothetical protein